MTGACNKRIDNFLALKDGKDYDVREDGSIWTCRSLRGHITKSWRKVGYNESGYETIGHQWAGKRVRLRTHRVVFRKFKGKLKEGCVINHIDGNRSNNHPDNLEQVTPSINNLHANLRNSPNRSTARFTDEQVADMRAMHKAGATYREIRAKYGLSGGNLSDIMTGKIYNGQATVEEKIAKIDAKIARLQAQKEYLLKSAIKGGGVSFL